MLEGQDLSKKNINPAFDGEVDCSSDLEYEVLHTLILIIVKSLFGIENDRQGPSAQEVQKLPLETLNNLTVEISLYAIFYAIKI